MFKNKKLISIFIILFLCLIYFITSEGFVLARNLYWGTRGNDVAQVQRRLKSWGYYKGAVDGVYGARTFAAVKLFQRKNGLRADGVVGPATKAALGLPATDRRVVSGSYKASRGGVSPRDDVYLLARLIYGEARGEPYIGKVAVGAVVMNRVRHPSFPKTIAAVIFQPGAFDAVDDGQIWLTPDAESIKAARDAINGWDPTGGAIYYYNPAKTTSRWIWSRPILTKIGKHIFAR